MLHARPSHTPWHAHTNIRRRVDIMTDLCTVQPFPIRLLLLVLVDAVLFLITALSNTLSHTKCRSQCPRGLRRRSAAARLLRSWVRILLGHGWLSVVSVVCCQRSLRRTDHSSRGVLPTVVRRSVWSRNFIYEEPNINQLWLSTQIRRYITGCIFYMPLIPSQQISL